MPLNEQFIADAAAHIIALEKSKPDEFWGRQDRRQAAQDYIEQQMRAGNEDAREHWYLNGREYDEVLDAIAERGYRALLTRIQAELEQRKTQGKHASSVKAIVDSGNISAQVYDAYHLAYNNVTYRAVRTALEEVAEISQRGSGRITESFVTDALNLLIDSSFERCGALWYQGSEAKLLEKLSSLDSYVTGLALRHLANFGISPVPGQPASLRQLIDELSIARAELRCEINCQCPKTYLIHQPEKRSHVQKN